MRRIKTPDIWLTYMNCGSRLIVFVNLACRYWVHRVALSYLSNINMCKSEVSRDEDEDRGSYTMPEHLHLASPKLTCQLLLHLYKIPLHPVWIMVIVVGEI